MENKIYHHGDVLLYPVKDIKGKKIKSHILAEGEITGHAHRIEKDKIIMYKNESEIYLSVLQEALLTHEEHKTIVIPPGNYCVGRVKEYDPFKKELENVQD